MAEQAGIERQLRSEALSASWLSTRLGVGTQRIDAMRRAGELIGVRLPGSQEHLYPAWQFDGAAPRASVRRIVAAAREAGLDEIRLYEVLTSREGLGGTRRLVDALRDGGDEHVIAAVRDSRTRVY